MTDNELQIAIDKTATLARESAAGAVREMSFKHLQELMNVQAARASLAIQITEASQFHPKKEFSVESWNKGFDAGYDKAREELQPIVKAGKLVQCKENRIGCEKILGGLCDCGSGTW